MTDLPHPAPLNSSRPPERPLPKPDSNGIQISPGPSDVATASAGAVRAFSRSKLKLGFGSRCVFYLMVAILHLMSLLPDFVLRPLGEFGGWIAYWLDRRHVEIGLKNLEVAFPDKSADDRRQILRGSYINLGRCAAEYIRLGGFFYRRLKRRVTYERFWVWDEVATRHPGKGILVLGAHFGNFELLSAAHALLGHQISLVHHTQRFLAGDALITFVRERAGVEVIRKHAAARPVLRALRANQLVAIPFDQNAKRSEAIFVPFFGEPAATTSGLARLVQISGAPVVPVFLVRQPDYRNHKLIIGDEIPIQASADPRADIEENTSRFVKAIEDMVRQYPEQFLWTHRRFRTRPRGSAKIYS
ncbi:MAG TPA: lysophospholipid acyltransferase family protein [Candidatus Binataceae bacterium]|nr:lysophospholipid acyltransferase family protein [Candidatus Binataceae bacterium]